MIKIRSVVVVILLICSVTILFCACREKSNAGAGYEQISQETAKMYMDTEQDYIILDTREAEEYAQGHIPDAMLIPYDEITQRAEKELPDKSALILVYCRSGRRSKIAAQSLADMGYTNVKEFGGIIDWEYETTP